jgi:hypothetical protein
MKVSEAITFWERRHHRLRMVAVIAFDPATAPAKKAKALSFMARWAPSHLNIWQKLADVTKPIPKFKSPFPAGGVAIVGESGREIIVVDDPGYGGKDISNKWFDTTLIKRLNK